MSERLVQALKTVIEKSEPVTQHKAIGRWTIVQNLDLAVNRLKIVYNESMADDIIENTPDHIGGWHAPDPKDVKKTSPKDPLETLNEFIDGAKINPKDGDRHESNRTRFKNRDPWANQPPREEEIKIPIRQASEDKNEKKPDVVKTAVKIPKDKHSEMPSPIDEVNTENLASASKQFEGLPEPLEAQSEIKGIEPLSDTTNSSEKDTWEEEQAERLRKNPTGTKNTKETKFELKFLDDDEKDNAEVISGGNNREPKKENTTKTNLDELRKDLEKAKKTQEENKDPNEADGLEMWVHDAKEKYNKALVETFNPWSLAADKSAQTETPESESEQSLAVDLEATQPHRIETHGAPQNERPIVPDKAIEEYLGNPIPSVANTRAPLPTETVQPINPPLPPLPQNPPPLPINDVEMPLSQEQLASISDTSYQPFDHNDYESSTPKSTRKPGFIGKLLNRIFARERNPNRRLHPLEVRPPSTQSPTRN